MPKQHQAPAAPALSIPAPSTPEDTERDLPGSAFFFPRWAAGRGCSTITSLAHGSLGPCSLRCQAALPSGEQPGGRGPSSPLLSVLAPRMCLFGGQVLQQLQDWLGQPSLCSVICSSSKKKKKQQNKPKGKEKRNKHIWQMPNPEFWSRALNKAGRKGSYGQYPISLQIPPPTTYELGL